MFKPIIGINVESKEGEKQEREVRKDENSKTGKSRVQPAAGNCGHDDREKQKTETNAPHRLSLRDEPVIRKEEHEMNRDPLTGKKIVKESRHKAYKVGGIWVDPMCFPFVKEDK